MNSSRGHAPSVVTALRRAVSWHRRTLAAIAAAIAVLTTITALSPAAPTTVRVVVAAVALPAGTELTEANLTLAAVPAEMVPDQAVHEVTELTGRVLAGARTAGEIMTTAAVVAPRPAGQDSGLVTTPIRLGDADVVALLAVGDLVDVVAADPRTANSAIVAEAARIVAIPHRDTSTGPLGTTPSGQDGQLVLVEVDPETATALATAAANGRLSVVWRS